MGDKELMRMGKDLDINSADIRLNASALGADDRASIITQDRLKKFNEIYGYDNSGPATREEHAAMENEEEDN
jgi:hypothetical protein